MHSFILLDFGSRDTGARCRHGQMDRVLDSPFLQPRLNAVTIATRLSPALDVRSRPMATATAALKRMYIDGEWCAADNGRTLGVINPATEEVIEEIAYVGRGEVRRAIEGAHRAMPAWMQQSYWDRA